MRAHGRRGDVLVALSTSGHSSNVLAAAGAAAEAGVTVLALTGEGPNPLAAAADDALCIPGATPTVQELHLLAVHLLCEAIDDIVLAGERPAEQLIDLQPDARGVR